MKLFCKITAALLVMLFVLLLMPMGAGADEAAVTVEPIDFSRSDFIRGMDLSSVLSLEAAGVRYYDESGKQQDLFRILSDHGVNTIRVRVWNDPYDKAGNGYGGGNNDVAKAAEIGSRAAACGMSLCVDFHYSDFWADPQKQKAPKAWADLSLDDKTDAVYTFTLNSLEEIKEAGAIIRMVQIGNETNGGIAGETERAGMNAVFSAGVRAVRDFDSGVLAALHFTNPEQTDAIKWQADQLAADGVDYDVFALSYYPYWHGSLTNLGAVLRYVATTYQKDVLIAETSYANTLNDADGHPNTVAPGANDSSDDLLWSFTPQGQAEELRAVMDTVNAIPGGRGLGVFYWEGAWISVGDTSGLSGSALTGQIESNRALWERYGAGWAASFAGEYDPDDAGRWYGGSAVDNQAFFDASGHVLPSLSVFRLVCGQTDATEAASCVTEATASPTQPTQPATEATAPAILWGDANGSGELDILDATAIQRHLAKLETLDDDAILRAKVTGEEELSILDATAIQRRLAHMIDRFPVEL